MSPPEAELLELEETIADLEEFLLHLPDAMVEIDLETMDVISMNWMARLHGRYPLDQPPLGVRAYDFIDPADVARAREAVDSYVGESREKHIPFTRAREVAQIELNLKRRDGTTFLAECEGLFSLDDEGIPERLAILFRDVTEPTRAEGERIQLLAELQEAVASARSLHGLLPICAVCKSVRDDRGYWTQIESYLRRNAGADFSHGLCPNCRAEVYPETSGEEPSS